MDNALFAAIDFCIRFLGNSLTKLAVAPIERYRLLLQTQDAHPLIISKDVPRYEPSLASTLRRLVREQGLASPWRSVLADLIRAFVGTSVTNLVGNVIPRASGSLRGSLLGFILNFSPAALGMIASFPFGYARTRLALDVGPRLEYLGAIDCIRKTVSSHGVQTLYTGLGLTLLGVMVYRLCHIGVNNRLRAWNPWVRSPGLSFGAMISMFSIAQLSTLSALFASYPLETICHRLQVHATVPQNQRLFSGAYSCLQEIVRTEGVFGLWKGAGAQVVKAILAALMLVYYDMITSGEN